MYAKDATTDKIAKKIEAINFDARWRFPQQAADSAVMQALFSQPFYFLGKGKQCIAYESEDGAFVVKLLLQKSIALKPRFANLPDFFPFTLLKEYKANMRLSRKKLLFESLSLSYQRLFEETGTLFVHLNPTVNLFGTMRFMDSQDNPGLVNLDQMQFVVQKKARLLKPVITQCMWQGDIEGAKKRIDQVFTLLFDCAKKGVFDIDTALFRNNNIGLLQDRAIYIDTGKLRYMPDKSTKEAFAKDLKRIKPFHKWLLQYYPELATYYEIREQQFIKAF